MTITVYIGGIHPGDVGEELVRKLKAVHDEEPENRWFKCMLPQDDPRTREVFRLLDEAGMTPWTASAKRDNKKEYSFRLIRHYSIDDLRQADFLQLRPTLFFGTSRRDPGGPLEVEASKLPEEGDFAGESMPWFLASRRVKQLVEASDLRHVIFRPIVLVESSNFYTRRIDPPVAQDAWWEIASDLEMPPLDMPLYEGWGRPIRDRDFSKGVDVKEGHYAHPQLHYAASSLAGWPEFDLARTSEPIGPNPQVTGHIVIASQRFFEFCLQHSLQTEWVPVWVHKDR